MFTDQTIFQYAVLHYRNSNPLELRQDLRRLGYIKKLLKKSTKDQPDNKIIINHIKTLGNVFGKEVATTLLFHQIDDPSLGSMLQQYVTVALD